MLTETINSDLTMAQIVNLNKSLMSLVISFALLIGLALPSPFADATSVPGGVYAWSYRQVQRYPFSKQPVFVVGQTALVGIPISKL